MAKNYFGSNINGQDSNQIHEYRISKSIPNGIVLMDVVTNTISVTDVITITFTIAISDTITIFIIITVPTIIIIPIN